MLSLVQLRAPSCSCWCSECSSTHKALALKLHLFTWSVKSDSCYNVLWLCSVQTQTCTSATTSNFFYWGGVVRLTAKPRYLLLLHRGKEKSNTVTALHSSVFYTFLTLFFFLFRTGRQTMRPGSRSKTQFCTATTVSTKWHHFGAVNYIFLLSILENVPLCALFICPYCVSFIVWVHSSSLMSIHSGYKLWRAHDLTSAYKSWQLSHWMVLFVWNRLGQIKLKWVQFSDE